MRKDTERPVIQRHKSEATMRPELVKDIRWFAKRPAARERLRDPSLSEKKIHGDDLLKVYICRQPDGGIVTQMIHGTVSKK